MSTTQSREEMLRELEAKGVLRPLKTFDGEPEAPDQQQAETQPEFDDSNRRARRVAELLSYAVPKSDEILAQREAERDARLLRYRDIVDAAHQHHQALRALYALAMPYSMHDGNGNEPGFEFLTRGDFVALLDLIMQPLGDALKSSEVEASHE
ncbi:MAG: hypothetical protein KGZ86_03085 [Candidatus Latescibacteria bacterium]|nr:hypothetical protein [Candidatus Latescibacterota bacterium]